MDFGYDLSIINIALKKTTSKANPSFDYLDKLLSDWHERNLKTAQEIEEFLAAFKQKNKNIKELKKKSFHLYDNRPYDDLDKLYDDVQTKKQG